MKNEKVDNNLFNSDRSIHVSDRAKRLLKFLSKYKELWYENGRSLEEKINMITINEREKKKIIDLYNQAEEDFAILRAVRTRFYEHQKGKHTTPEYRISESQLESLRQAGVGRTFGLSDKNQAEYDRLVKAGVDEDIVEFIFKKFTSYDRFKEIFREAIEQGRELEVLRKCPKAQKSYISDIDLSVQNGVSNVDRNYIDLLRDILEVKYFVFDGEKIQVRLDEFLNFKDKKSHDSLSTNEKDIVCKIYGIGREKMTSDQIRRAMGISNSRVRQILKTALIKLSNRKSELLDVVYLSDEKEAAKLLSGYYKNNDVFRGSNNFSEIDKVNQSRNGRFTDINQELYCQTFAKNLKEQIENLRYSRAEVSQQYKLIFDTLLNDIEMVRIEDFYVGRMPIDRLALSRKLNGKLSSNGIITVGDIIKYSRSCNGSIKDTINLKDEAYLELKASLEKLGLNLDEDSKNDDIRRKNDFALNHMSKDDNTKFYLYLEQIRYGLRMCIIENDIKEELESHIDQIKKRYGIYISDRDLVRSIHSRIFKLDFKHGYTTSIDTLDIPHEITRVLNLHGINKVRDIYSIGDRGDNYIKKRYRLYLDMIIAELNRMGLNYKTDDENQLNVLKQATYVNKMNMELITFLIDESNLDRKQKYELKQELLDKVKHVETDLKAKDINKKIVERIETLGRFYKKDLEKNSQEHEDR